MDRSASEPESTGAAWLGLISDTHGLLRPEALDELKGCDRIIHAGDVGNREVIERLSEIAPVTAIKGNIDVRGWTASLPETAVVQWNGKRICVVHDLNTLHLDPNHSVDIVVSGHSHKPLVDRRSGVLYVNPGSAGRRRFRLPITVGRLSVTELHLQVSIFDLVSGGRVSTTTMAR